MARKGFIKVAFAVFLAGALITCALEPSAFAQSARGGLQVANHIFTTSVTRAEDGSFSAADVLVGFERGTASFQTLTQVVLPRGNHRISLAIIDPGGSELSRVNFPAIEASTDDWTQTLVGTWRNIRFAQAGRYAMILYLGNQEAARFQFVVR